MIERREKGIDYAALVERAESRNKSFKKLEGENDERDALSNQYSKTLRTMLTTSRIDVEDQEKQIARLEELLAKIKELDKNRRALGELNKLAEES